MTSKIDNVGKINHIASRRLTAERLVEDLHRTVDGLAADGADRGDLKLLARTMRELRYAFRVFAGQRGSRKVTVFGSARLPPGAPACLQATAFGSEMARLGWFVVTGAGQGIMEAAHVGAGPDLSMGINIMLPFEQPDNTMMAGNPLLIHVKYFFTRKLLFIKESDGVALFPGGFGTLDEAFEVLTLLQTGKSHMFPVVLMDEPGGDYWTRWRTFIEEDLLARGMISPEDLSLFRITDDVNDAIGEIAGFYRVYHSMRYVGSHLVIRLQRPLPDRTVESLNETFSDILASGMFQQASVLPGEEDEPELDDLPRIVFPFNRKNFGRLRQLIDALNRQED
jgi:uncharacterized protein (TIGR00730 family)